MKTKLENAIKRVVEIKENTADIGTYRLDLDKHELIHLIYLLENTHIGESESAVFCNMLNKMKHIQFSAKKTTCTVVANKAKIIKSKEKVQNAVNLLRLEDRLTTVANIAKTAGISYNTAKKYYHESYRPPPVEEVAT